MKRLKLALLIGFLGLIIAVLHILAINLFLYWDIFWFDIVMHFLGGAWVALLGFWILAFFTHKEEFNKKDIYLIAILFSLGVGILWEIFEFGAGLTFTEFITPRDAWIDTFSDLILDTIGGLTAGFLVYGSFSKKRSNIDI